MPLPRAFSVGVPKAELHCHIEGTVTPKQKWDLAQRNNVRLPYDTYEELLAAHEYSADNPTEILRKFLDLYYANHVVFKTEQDYRDIMFEHLRRCASGNVRYSEIFFGAQGHLALGIPLEVLMNGLRAGIEEGEREFGVKARLLLSINRGRSAESGLETVKLMTSYQDIVIGIGMGGLEVGNPPVKMKDAFDFAKAQGWRLTCHCDVDQQNSVEHIRQCVEVLGVDRIDHGMNVIDDPRLVEACIERNICLTVCPTWWAGGSDPYRIARVRELYDAGLKVTLNSDDPGMMSSGMLHELLPRVVDECGFTATEVGQLMRNAFDGAWLSHEQRTSYHHEVDNYLAAAPS